MHVFAVFGEEDVLVARGGTCSPKDCGSCGKGFFAGGEFRTSQLVHIVAEPSE